MIAAILLLYRRQWISRLRDRLASDGITANEVVWFRSELTSAERTALKEIEQNNPLLADAYLETLASRLTASRIISRSKREILQVERRINRARSWDRVKLPPPAGLVGRSQRLKQLLQQANQHLAHAKTRLQEIEATASRKLSQEETELMMQRLGSTQNQLPLVLEMAQLERQSIKGNQFATNPVEHGSRVIPVCATEPVNTWPKTFSKTIVNQRPVPKSSLRRSQSRHPS